MTLDPWMIRALELAAAFALGALFAWGVLSASVKRDREALRRELAQVRALRARLRGRG